jgi:serine protease
MTTHTKVKLLAASLLLAMALPAAAADFAAQAGRYDLSSVREEDSYDRFIVVYRDGSSERASQGAAVQTLSAAAARARLAGAAGAAAAQSAATRAGGPPQLGIRYGRRLATGGDLLRTSRRLSAAEARQFVQQVAADPAVAFVQPDYLRHALDTETLVRPTAAAPFTAPDDTYYGAYQWEYLAPDGAAFNDGTLGTAVANWGGANIQRAWSLADGSGIVIASLDTGVTQHPDLDLTLADAGYDFTSDALVSGRSSDGRAAGGWDPGDWTTGSKYLARNGGCVDNRNVLPEDSSWHGTHVFGTAGGEKTDNATGMAGTAFGAKVLPVRVLGHCGGYDSDIADAITWASGGSVAGVPANAHKAQVISLSLGGSGVCTASTVLGQAVSGAIARGTVVVVAAGNSNADVANFSPASCPGVVAVAASGITSKRAYYSNYGSKVTLAAPGGGVYRNDGSSGSQADTGFIWSTINAGTTVPTTATYGGMAGTSQATPHVAGTVALVQSYRLALGKALLTPAQVTTVLTTSAAAPHTAAPSNRPIGAGLLDAYAALQAAAALP